MTTDNPTPDDFGPDFDPATADMETYRRWRAHDPGPRPSRDPLDGAAPPRVAGVPLGSMSIEDYVAARRGDYTPPPPPTPDERADAIEQAVERFVERVTAFDPSTLPIEDYIAWRNQHSTP